MCLRFDAATRGLYKQQVRTIALLVLYVLASPNVAKAENQNCGSAPSLPLVEENEDVVKGQLNGKADLLLKFLGKAELGGQIEKTKKEIYQNSSAFFAAQKDAYLAYIFCKLILSDTSQPFEVKTNAIQVYRGVIVAPPAKQAPAATMALLVNATQSLDGYSFVKTPTLSAELPKGPLLAGGGRTRLVFQASNPDQIVEIGKVQLVVQRRDIADKDSLSLSINPEKSSGFGAARPRTFNFKLGEHKVEGYFVDEKKAAPVKVENVLSGTNISLLRLDRSAGLQETLDFAFLVSGRSLYELRFVAVGSAKGQEFEMSSGPIYVVGR